MSRKIKMIYDFNDAACLEVEYKQDKWARVTSNTFRSTTGRRRIDGVEYIGPVYYEGSNKKYTPRKDEKSRVVGIEELNTKRKVKASPIYEEIRSYDRDEKYKKAILPNKAYL